jgi:hypothetical protein
VRIIFNFPIRLGKLTEKAPNCKGKKRLLK